MSTPTPRTSAAIIASGFQAVPEGFRAFAGILERELAALTAERDQLRAVFPQICAAIGNGAFCTPTVSVGFIQSIPNEVQLVVAELRARAERAEDNLAALEQCHDDNCRGLAKIADDLTTERARLDWLESPAGMDWQWQAGITRATIDAKMQKDAK